MKSVLRSLPRYAPGVDKGIMPEGYLEAPLAYDAIWALSLGNEKKRVGLLTCSSFGARLLLSS